MASLPAAAVQWRIEFDRAAQIKAVLVGLAFIAFFHNILIDLTFYQWWDPNWGHGWLIPLFSIYLARMHWDSIRRCPIRHTWVGLVLLVAGLLSYEVTLWWLRYTYFQRASMLITLLGVLLVLCGLPVLRYIWVPWLYLFFAIPLPQGLYFRLTDPLARAAGEVATWVLGLLDLQMELTGQRILYVHEGRAGELFVADACAGMRSVMTLCALGVAVAFLSDRPWWQRIVMVLSCVPIAILSNFVRVTATCLLHVYAGPEYTIGTPHTLLGLGTMFLAFLMFLGLGWVLSNLFVEAPEAEPTGAAPPRG